MTNATTCLWCDMPATRYCDAVIGFGVVGVTRQPDGSLLPLAGPDRITGDIPHWTCDAPMCATHAKQVGLVCGANADSIDRCPWHAEYGDGKIRDRLVVDADEAASWRRQIWADVRRTRIKQAGFVQS